MNPARGQYPRSLLTCLLSDRREQGGLPDAGFAADDEGAASILVELASQVVENTEFALAPIHAALRGITSRRPRVCQCLADRQNAPPRICRGVTATQTVDPTRDGLVNRLVIC